MKRSKILSMLILVFVCVFIMSASILTVSAEDCEHNIDGAELHEADWNPCEGGRKTAYYRCNNCGQTVDAALNIVEWEDEDYDE